MRILELVGFTHSGGDLEKKLASFKKNGDYYHSSFPPVRVVRMIVAESMSPIAAAELDLDVVRYTS